MEWNKNTKELAFFVGSCVAVALLIAVLAPSKEDDLGARRQAVKVAAPASVPAEETEKDDPANNSTDDPQGFNPPPDFDGPQNPEQPVVLPEQVEEQPVRGRGRERPVDLNGSVARGPDEAEPVPSQDDAGNQPQS